MTQDELNRLKDAACFTAGKEGKCNTHLPERGVRDIQGRRVVKKYLTE